MYLSKSHALRPIHITFAEKPTKGQQKNSPENECIYCTYTKNLSTIFKLSRIIVLILLRHIKPFDDVACFGPQLSTTNDLEKNDQFRLNLIIKLHRKCFYSYLHYFIYDYPVSTLPFCFFFFFSVFFVPSHTTR